MPRFPLPFPSEERQYGPFIGGAIFFGLIIGFPLGFLLAHAAAQGSDLGGRWWALAQAHGHLQLMGWAGLFVMGMGFRLVPRFTGVRVQPGALVPLTFFLMVASLLLRIAGQPYSADQPMSFLFAASAVLEVGAALLFAGTILRCLAGGRKDEYLYSPFFGAGAVWVVVAALLNLVFILDAVGDSRPVLKGLQSLAATSVLLYGFIPMFILAVSLRTFPIFFQRSRVQWRVTMAIWVALNGALVAYVAGIVWHVYDISADTRVLQTGGMLAMGVALIAMVGNVRIFEGNPHRLHVSSRQSMRFARSAYAWLLLTAAVQVFFAVRALLDGRLLAFYEMDALRHFLALGFVMPMIIGMAFLVLPRLAMLRGQGVTVRRLGPILLVLLHSAAAARGVGSLLMNEAQVESGFWTMSVGGLAAILALGLFAGYLLRQPKPIEIPLPESLTVR